MSYARLGRQPTVTLTGSKRYDPQRSPDAAALEPLSVTQVAMTWRVIETGSPDWPPATAVSARSQSVDGAGDRFMGSACSLLGSACPRGQSLRAAFGALPSSHLGAVVKRRLPQSMGEKQ